jgi:Cu(I)/Ag(I) efflux system membrane protein CusA/SilA
VRTPIGVKIFGSDLDEIERVGTELEHVLAPIAGTRSVLYERNLGGLYVDIVPRPEKLARYGLRVGDVERLIESAIGGTPIGVTVEGRNRFSINVRYPRDARGDLEALRRLLVPVGGSTNDSRMGTQGALWPPRGSHGVVLADNMNMGGGASPAAGPPRVGLPTGRPSMSDASPGMAPGAMPGGAAVPELAAPLTGGTPPAPATAAGLAFVPLGDLADIRIVGGPPMVRDEAGLLVGYVYVDIDQAKRDLGGYVDEAKAAVAHALGDGALKLPPGSYLKWTGQYEQLEEMTGRMKLVVPLTLLIICALLYFQFRNVTEVLIVLLSIPFALVGSVWLLWLLDYRLSTAVWVGIIALVGLAAQTGIVMIVYVDNAYRRRKAEGRIHDLRDIVAAHMEGTVQRVRPKLMTVSTMLIGLMPLLWAKSAGADVMKRIAAPMVGGLVTSAFLTLEIIPVVVTYWRQEQLLWERLAELAPERLRALQTARAVLAVGAALAAALGVLGLYVVIPAHVFGAAEMAAGALFLVGCGVYLVRRPAARAIVWPTASDA